MDRAAFEAAARADGFDIAERAIEPNRDVGDHTHAFDARLLILDGEFALTIAGERRVYGPGDWCDVPSGTVHAEHSGPQGARVSVGRRQAA